MVEIGKIEINILKSEEFFYSVKKCSKLEVGIESASFGIKTVAFLKMENIGI